MCPKHTRSPLPLTRSRQVAHGDLCILLAAACVLSWSQNGVDGHGVGVFLPCPWVDLVLNDQNVPKDSSGFSTLSTVKCAMRNTRDCQGHAVHPVFAQHISS